jgi:hypothetical protein
MGAGESPLNQLDNDCRERRKTGKKIPTQGPHLSSNARKQTCAQAKIGERARMAV